jgi:hypothetical protein
MSLELTTSVFIPWGEFCIEMLASCWCHWLVPNWHLFYCLTAEQILQTNNVEVISYYPSQTYWMYLFWAFVEALGLIGHLASFWWWRVLMAQEVWTYRMARRCIPGSAVLLGCQYKVLKSVVQEPLAVRCRMRWVVYDNVVCLSPNVGLFGTDTYSVVSLLCR